MRYLPKSPAERREMLDAIGARSIENLFASIPEPFRLKEPLKLPAPMSEQEIIEYFRARAAENSCGYTSFLGAGVYNHLRSVVTDSLIQRGEFLTSYTPYQAEISQGTLQAIFEFQTLMCELTGMEVANASMWDGSTATTEAVLMAERLTGRHRVVVARSLHPEYRQVLETYTRNLGLRIDEIGFTTAGQVDANRLEGAINSETAAVVVQSPNFFGVLEQMPSLAALAHAKGALLVVAITEGVSLGAVRPPAEADIVAMEGQSFGLPPSYGGPYAGVIATREKFVRQMPGRLAGETVDSRREARLRAHAGHARAAHSPREGHFEYLHQSGALRPGREHSSLPARQGGLEGTGGAESGQGAIRARRAGKNSRRAPGVFRPVFQRIRGRVSALREAGERGIAAAQNYRAAAARKLLRGPDQARPVLRHGNNFARGNRTHGRSDPGNFVEADLRHVAQRTSCSCAEFCQFVATAAPWLP